MKMQRETCIGSAQLRGSEKKKNGAKIASERETNSLQSLKGPRKTVASRYQHHHHHHRPRGGYNHSRFFSSYPHRHLQKYHLQCLAEPVVSICLIWIEFSEHKTALNCLTFQNRYIIFSQKAIKAMQPQFPTVSKTGAVFQLDSSICKTSEHSLPQEYSLHCTHCKCAQTSSHLVFLKKMLNKLRLARKKVCKSCAVIITFWWKAPGFKALNCPVWF